MALKEQFANLKTFFSNKKILITGNTGFKGSWLSLILLELGSEIKGLSKDIPTKPSMFETFELENHFETFWGDVSGCVPDFLRKLLELSRNVPSMSGFFPEEFQICSGNCPDCLRKIRESFRK